MDCFPQYTAQYTSLLLKDDKSKQEDVSYHYGDCMKHEQRKTETQCPSAANGIARFEGKMAAREETTKAETGEDVRLRLDTHGQGK